jgi:hypothetical protein
MTLVEALVVFQVEDQEGEETQTEKEVCILV